MGEVGAEQAKGQLMQRAHIVRMAQGEGGKGSQRFVIALQLHQGQAAVEKGLRVIGTRGQRLIAKGQRAIV